MYTLANPPSLPPYSDNVLHASITRWTIDDKVFSFFFFFLMWFFSLENFFAKIIHVPKTFPFEVEDLNRNHTYLFLSVFAKCHRNMSHNRGTKTRLAIITSETLTFQFVLLQLLQHLDKSPAALWQWPAFAEHLRLDHILVRLRQREINLSTVNIQSQ